MTHPVDLNDGINIFTAEKAAPSVYRAGTPQFLQLGGNHEPLAARTTHRHRSIFLSGRPPRSLGDSHLAD